MAATRSDGTREPSWYHVRPVRAAFAPICALSFGVALTAAACASRQQGTPIGMSDAVPEEPSPELRADPPSLTWPDFAAARAWPEAGPPRVSLGHWRDGTLIHVRVEPSSLAAYRELSVESGMPDGARVVAWHETPAGVLLGGDLLEKRSGRWMASELNADGALAPGDHARCIRCHDMAPTDHLFGVGALAGAPPAASAGRESITPELR